MLCKCHWILLYSVHVTAFCLRRPFFSGHGVFPFSAFLLSLCFRWTRRHYWCKLKTLTVVILRRIFISLCLYHCQVVVNCPSAGCEQKFRCGKWLATDEGDGFIERTLHETSRKMREKSTTVSAGSFCSIYTHTHTHILLKSHNKLARIKQSKT